VIDDREDRSVVAVSYYSPGAPRPGITGRRLVAHNPMRESGHRLVTQSLAERDELGVAPGPALRELHARPSSSRTVGTAMMSMSKFKSRTIRRMIASC